MSKAVYGFDEKLCTHPATWDAFDTACRKGVRWHEIHESIVLPEAFRPATYPGNQQSWLITSAGPNAAGFVRGFSGAPVIDMSDTGEAQFTIRDLNVDCRKDLYPATSDAPNVGVQLANAFLSEGSRIKVFRPAGNGVEIGPEINALDLGVAVHDGDGWGVVNRGGTDLHLKANIERCNGGGGVLWQGPTNDQPHRGPGSIRMHGEQNTVAADPENPDAPRRGLNLRIEGATSVSVRESYFYLGDVEWDDACDGLAIADNLLVDSLLLGDPARHRVENNRVVIWMNTRPEGYVVPESAPRMTLAELDRRYLRTIRKRPV